MYKFNLCLVASVFFLLTSNALACRISDEKKIHESAPDFQKLNLSEGLCQLWYQGKQYVDFIFVQVGEVAQDGHSKNFEDDEYNFFSYQETNFKSPNVNPIIANDPVNRLLNLVNEFQTAIGGKYPQNIEARSNIYQLAVGIYINLEKAKNIAIGRKSELRGLQNYLFDQLMDFYLTAPKDPSFAGTILLYTRARHFHFPKNYLLTVANEISTVADQHYRPSKGNEIQENTGTGDKYKGMKTVAMNMFAFCEIGGTPDRFNFHFKGRRIQDWCVRNSINLSRELGYPEIELLMRRRLSKYIQEDFQTEERISNSIEILRLEKNKIKSGDWWKNSWLSFWLIYYQFLAWLPTASIILFMIMFLIGIISSPTENTRGFKRLISGFLNFSKKIFGIGESKLNFFDRLFILTLPVLVWMLLSPSKLNSLIEGL